MIDLVVKDVQWAIKEGREEASALIRYTKKERVMAFLLNKNFLFIGIAFLLIAAQLFARARKPKLNVGDIAPAFTLQGDDGKTYKLSDFDNQKVALYFYPLDNSPGCTKQACSLARGYDLLKENRIKLFGINHQSPKSHTAFKESHTLPFILLSDPTNNTIRAYGAYSPLFVKRLTFLIDKGKIIAILRKIDVNDHADQIVRAFALNK